MTRYLPKWFVVSLHERAILQYGGSAGIRDEGALDSALAQPRMTFGGQERYPDLREKAAALGCSLILNHPFIDENKRVGYAAMEAFLMLNQHEIVADVNDAARITLSVAAGTTTRDELIEWLQQHNRPLSADG